MQPITLSYREALIYFAITAVIGFVFGLIPLFIGYLNGKKKYGVIGFITSIVSGAFFGIYLAVPVNVIFVWLIMESRLIRMILGTVIFVTGLVSAVFGFLRLNSTFSEIVATRGGNDSIAFGFFVGGISYAIIGVVLIVLTFYAKTASDRISGQSDLS